LPLPTFSLEDTQVPSFAYSGLRVTSACFDSEKDKEEEKEDKEEEEMP
jgi:hypothetical protein